MLRICTDATEAFGLLHRLDAQRLGRREVWGWGNHGFSIRYLTQMCMYSCCMYACMYIYIYIYMCLYLYVTVYVHTYHIYIYTMFVCVAVCIALEKYGDGL